MTTFWYCLVVGLFAYGLGLRVSNHFHLKEAKRAVAEFNAKAAKLDEQITEAQEH